MTDELAEAQRRYYEGLQNAPPGTLSPAQDEPSPRGWEGLWKLQRDLCEHNRREARKYCLWAWFWFAFAAAEFVVNFLGLWR